MFKPFTLPQTSLFALLLVQSPFPAAVAAQQLSGCISSSFFGWKASVMHSHKESHLSFFTRMLSVYLSLQASGCSCISKKSKYFARPRFALHIGIDASLYSIIVASTSSLLMLLAWKSSSVSVAWLDLSAGNAFSQGPQHFSCY